MLAQFLDAFDGPVERFLAFIAEGDGNDADRQLALLLGGLGHQRRGAGTGAAAHAAGHEYHLRIAFKEPADFLERFLGGLASDRVVGAGAQTLGQDRTDLELGGYGTLLERLRVGVAHDEIHVLESELVHIGNGIVATAAHTDDRDDVAPFLPAGRY